MKFSNEQIMGKLCKNILKTNQKKLDNEIFGLEKFYEKKRWIWLNQFSRMFKIIFDQKVHIDILSFEPSESKFKNMICFFWNRQFVETKYLKIWYKTWDLFAVSW